MTVMERERRRRGWTQTRLAANAGLHQSQISDIERGKVEPTEGQRVLIASTIGVDPAELTRQAEQTEEEPVAVAAD